MDTDKDQTESQPECTCKGVGYGQHLSWCPLADPFAFTDIEYHE